MIIFRNKIPLEKEYLFTDGLVLVITIIPYSYFRKRKVNILKSWDIDYTYDKTKAGSIWKWLVFAWDLNYNIFYTKHLREFYLLEQMGKLDYSNRDELEFNLLYYINNKRLMNEYVYPDWELCRLIKEKNFFEFIKPRLKKHFK